MALFSLLVADALRVYVRVLMLCWFHSLICTQTFWRVLQHWWAAARRSKELLQWCNLFWQSLEEGARNARKRCLSLRVLWTLNKPKILTPDWTSSSCLKHKPLSYTVTCIRYCLATIKLLLVCQPPRQPGKPTSGDVALRSKGLRAGGDSEMWDLEHAQCCKIKTNILLQPNGWKVNNQVQKRCGVRRARKEKKWGGGDATV